MSASEGLNRVIIKNITPQVECGLYAAKAVTGEELTILADVFCDGHDEISVSLHIKHLKERSWQEYPMSLINNDSWTTSFTPQKLGFYTFYVEAWVDHYTTWQKGFLKKLEDGQNVDVDLEIGIELLRQHMALAKGADKTKIQKTITDLQKGTSAPAGLLNNIREVTRRTTDRSNTAKSGELMLEVDRVKAAFSTWYELFPRSTAQQPGQHGTFEDVRRLLPRIASMGFDVLYLPPIHPIGEVHRKGKNNSLQAEQDDPGSPWAIGNKNGGHKAIHEQLGGLSEFKNLITEAAAYGIDIAMDIAFQCAPDHPYVTEHPQWFRWRPDGTVQYAENPPKKYEDILPFNFETEDWKNLWNELKSVFEYWIKVGINVFRVDNPHTKSFPFWKWVIAEIKKKNPQVIFLAEAFTRPKMMEHLARVGFSQSYTYFTWRNTKEELEEYLTELSKTDRRFYFRPNFWPNTPDILPPGLTYGGDNAHIARVILAATMSSNYGLYGPVYEFGINTPMPKKEEYVDNEKYEVRHWDWEQYTRIGEIIARVNRIRKENTALHTTWNIEFARTTNDQIICYTKYNAKDKNLLIIAVNLDPFNTQSANVYIPLKKVDLDSDRPYRVHDLLSGDTYTWSDEQNYVELNPYNMPAHIFLVEQ